MEHGKKIAYKTAQIRQIAYKLRHLIRKAVLERKSKIHRNFSRLVRKPQRLRQRFNDKIDTLRKKEADLNKALDNSICICPGCGRSDKVMIYYQKLGQWWCEPCFKDRAEFYYEMKPIIDAGGFVGDFDEKFHKTFVLNDNLN